MTAIALEQRGEHLATIEKVFGSVITQLELPNGYGFMLPNESDVVLTVAQFIALERLCCPFLGFSVEVVRDGGPIFLSLTGIEGIKPFIMAEIGEHLPRNARLGQ